MDTAKFKNIIFKCGLLKSGDGTLRLTSNDCIFSGATTIEEGVLQVDGELINSDVTVKEGGLVGGSGKIHSLTLEDGAGFEVHADQTQPLLVETLTVEGHAVVYVRCAGGFDHTQLDVPFMQTSGAFDAGSLSVRVDGVPQTPDLRVRIGDDGIAYARWSPLGTLLKIK